MMDIKKFKSVAVPVETHALLKGLCGIKYRAPAGMITKLVNEYVAYLAAEKKLNVDKFKKSLLNGEASHDRT